MRRSALADVLRDLAPGARALPAMAITEPSGGMDAEAPENSPGDAVVLDEAYQAGLTAGRREALEEVAHRLEEARAQAEATLEQERAQWIDSVSGIVDDKLTEGIRQLEHELFDVVSRCLRPMVREFASAEASNQILSAVQDVLSIGKTVTVNVEGPERLLEALAGRLAKQGIAHRLVPSAGFDIKVQCGSTTIVTRLAELLARFEELDG